MRVHILRSLEVDEQLYDHVMELLSIYPGTISFVPARCEKEERQSEADIPPEDSALDGVLHISRGVSWDVLFAKCNAYRKKHDVGDEDRVVLLTDIPNKPNWFSSWEPANPRNFFVHTAEWNFYVDGDDRYPIAYEIMFNLLATELHDFEDIEKSTHEKALGCMFDFCMEKKDITLKMRTGDICPSCQKLIRNKDVDPFLVQHVFRIVDAIRTEMLFKQRFDALLLPSRLVVDFRSRHLVFRDITSLKVRLNPRQMALYLVFLDHEKGIAYRDLDQYKDQLKRYYAQLDIHDRDHDEIIPPIHNAIDNLFGFDNDLSTEVSRINRKLRSVLGEGPARFYQILGANAENKSIAIDRQLVTMSDRE